MTHTNVRCILYAGLLYVENETNREFFMRRYVTYVRVSTQEQGRSGLGLEAQKRDIDLFLQNYSDVPWEVIGDFADIGSGADNGRPELQKALDLVRKTGAELLVAKVDRLSRKVSHLATLLDDPKIKIRVASMPHADKFSLHIYAALAEQERNFISIRTKAALAAAKAKGVKLGGERGNLESRIAAKKRLADVRAQKVFPIIKPLREQGASYQAIADQLVGMGFGEIWTSKKVQRALARLEEA
jgi:DNA invertase Pin-like site-specific DNA recombinase